MIYLKTPHLFPSCLVDTISVKHQVHWDCSFSAYGKLRYLLIAVARLVYLINPDAP